MADDDHEEFRFMEGYNFDDVARDYETPYAIEESDEKSIADIAGRVERRRYTRKQQAREHLEYLEHLANKLTVIRQAEERKGMANEALNDALSRVTALARQLRQRCNELE